MKVSQFYNKNQFLIENNGEKYFQSYDSLIAKVGLNGRLTLYTDWNFSNTTRKHLYMFLEDYCYGVYNLIRNSSNKRKTLQELIDLKKVDYQEEE